MNEPVKLVTTKPDAEVAEELKKELITACQSWLDACTKAHKAGFNVAAQFGPDFTGKYVILGLGLSKNY